MEFLALLSARIYSIPFYMVWLGGIAYALVNRQKHPRTSLFAAIGLGILLVENLLSAVLSAYIQYQAFESGASPAQFGTRLAALSFCSIPVALAGWILLFIALFGREKISEREAVINHAD